MRNAAIILFILSGILLFGMYSMYRSNISQPLSISENYLLDIKKGQSLNSVAHELDKKGIIDNALYLKVHAKMSGQGHKIKAGEYKLDSSLSIEALLQKLVLGDVTLKQITIPEGVTFREMLMLIHNNENISADLKGKSDTEIMHAIGYADEHPEGRFLPETYHFAKGTNDKILLQQSYQAMQDTLNTAWAQKSENTELKTSYEALILASIIEKETGVFDEQATIAGVFNSRLRKGMRLQTDPTVIYGMGQAYTGNIRRKDLETDTPYNTYTRSGLPPTPIALPGKNAINAAVKPETHNKLYFVATGDGDGRHNFSSTLEEHNKAVQQYLKKYRLHKSK